MTDKITALDKTTVAAFEAWCDAHVRAAETVLLAMAFAQTERALRDRALDLLLSACMARPGAAKRAADILRGGR